MFIPTGQNLEDVMLYRCFAEVKLGKYIDVGAGEYNQPSVTQSFYDLGWDGILIDPIPSYKEVYRQYRPRDIFLSAAAGSSNANDGKLFEIQGGFSTLDYEILNMHLDNGLNYTTHEVEILSLDSIWESFHLKEVHFLKIDVEGFELEVLRGLSLARHRPWIIVLEVAIPGTTTRTELNFEGYLANFQYTRAYHDGINDFYLASEHKYLEKNFSTPVNISDGPWFTSSTDLRNKILDRDIQIGDLTNRLMELTELNAHREQFIFRYLSALIVNKIRFYIHSSRRK